jgi:hypothetical protein
VLPKTISLELSVAARIYTGSAASLPLDCLAQLWPHLEAVELSLRAVLQAGTQFQPYFLETGYVSMLTYMEDGDTAEVGLVGREGVIGPLSCC